MGNHEDMLMNYCRGIDNSWTYNGHWQTMKSYDGFDEQFDNDIEWMKNLPLYFEDEHFIYVHAGINVYKSMERQDENDLLWIREPFIYAEKEYYKTVIFGHTPTMNFGVGNKPIYTLTGNIDIDTGCVFGGALTALIIEDGEAKRFYQVNKEKSNKKTIA